MTKTVGGMSESRGSESPSLTGKTVSQPETGQVYSEPMLEQGSLAEEEKEKEKEEGKPHSSLSHGRIAVKEGLPVRAVRARDLRDRPRAGRIAEQAAHGRAKRARSLSPKSSLRIGDSLHPQSPLLHNRQVQVRGGGGGGSRACSVSYWCWHAVYHEKIARLKRLQLRVLRRVRKVFLIRKIFTHTPADASAMYIRNLWNTI